MLNKKIISSILILSIVSIFLVNFVSSEKTAADLQKEFEDAQKDMNQQFNSYSENINEIEKQSKTNIGFLAIFGITLGTISLLLFIWALLDILKANNKGTWKILWIIVCLFGFIGVLIYIFIGRKKKK